MPTRATRRTLVLIAMLVPAGVALAQTTTTAPATAATVPAALRQRVDSLIGRLDADDLPVRQTAGHRLATIEPEALPLLRDALRRSDLSPEARIRLQAATDAVAKSAPRWDRERRAAAWYHRTVVEAYEKSSRHDPKWDEPARKAVGQMEHYFTRHVEGEADAAAERAWDTLRRCDNLGCDDPFVLYLRADVADQRRGRQPKSYVDWYLLAADGLRKSTYPPVRKAYALVRAAHALHADPGSRTKRVVDKMALPMLDEAIALLPEVVSDREAPPDVLMDLCKSIVDTRHDLTGQRKPGFEKVEAVLEKHCADGYLLDVFRGNFYCSWAWDARGGDWGIRNGADGAQLFADRLALARPVLERAFALDPTRAGAPEQMLSVELGEGNGRDEMEKWWKRAMDADPDDYFACRRKAWYLQPRWHGSTEEALAFGHDLVDDGNWDARLPFVLVDTHQWLAGMIPGGQATDEQQKYFHSRAVWADISRVYESYLSLYPKSKYDWCRYARFAVWCQQWKKADELLASVSDEPDPRVFPSKDEFEKLRGRVANRALKEAKN